MSGASAQELLEQVTDAIEGGQRRPAQEEMTAAVDEAIRARRHVAIQGPTGVGKSLAYLLPAIVAARDGTRTVVVTSSRALQDQLGRVDLPFLAATLDEPVDFAVLKGRSNYLCAAALDEVKVRLGDREDRPQLELDDEAPETGPDLTDDAELAELDAVLEWSETTSTGDVAELDVTPSVRVWSAVSVGPAECVGAANCDHAEDCWSESARASADGASIVVVNAHLYAAHVESGRSLLAEHSNVIIDEAHAFEDSIVGALSIEMSEGRIANLARVHASCVAEDQKVGTSLRSAATLLDATLEGLLDGATSPTRLRDGLGVELAATLATVVSAADRALNGLRRAARSAGDGPGRHKVDRAVRIAESVLGDAQTLLGEHRAGSVCWIEPRGKDRRAVRLTRIDVADTLRQLAWEDDDLTVVCCSATLDRHTAARLGLDAEYLAVASPFDFSENAVLYVPKLVRPNHPDWPEQLAEVIAHLITELDGRTLALFTSNRMLRATVDRCRESLGDHVLLAQGDAPNPVLHRQFLAEEHTSLFATASFWTGMSSPGSTCSAVVLDKIPFPVPTDPIVEARSELVGDRRAFAEVSVPAAAMQLAQGVGRLIRTTTDRGVVMVGDPRLAEAGYREDLLALLPPMRRVRNAAFVDRFIESLALESRRSE